MWNELQSMMNVATLDIYSKMHIEIGKKRRAGFTTNGRQQSIARKRKIKKHKASKRKSAARGGGK